MKFKLMGGKDNCQLVIAEHEDTTCGLAFYSDYLDSDVRSKLAENLRIVADELIEEEK